ncbi:MAG: hypothetical protein ABI972_28515 [Acidobacteriota bacterium]
MAIDRREIGHGSTSPITALLQSEIETSLHELIGRRGLTGAQRALTLTLQRSRNSATPEA